MKHLALVAVAGCGAGGYPMAVRPDVLADDCRLAYLDEPVHAVVAWHCGFEDGARRGPDRCDQAVVVTPHCSGVECNIVAPKLESTNAESSALAVEVTPRTLGELQLVLELDYASGYRESYVAARCEIRPKPDVAFECTTRDPHTGELLTCPAELPPGAQVFVRAYALAGKPIWRDVAVDGARVDRGAFRCDRVRDANEMRCYGTLPAGDHVIAFGLAGLPARELRLVYMPST